MPILKNVKHEKFAQEVAKGKTADEAYRLAGYQENRKNASRLKTRDDILSRIEEIQAKAAEKCGVTVERIVNELVKIGFSDIRNAVEWGSREILEEVRDPSVKKRGRPKLGNAATVVHDLKLKSSATIDDATAAAISEVKQTKEGIAIKFHDKRAALVDLGRHVGMFPKDGANLNVTVTLGDLVLASMTKVEGK